MLGGAEAVVMGFKLRKTYRGGGYLCWSHFLIRPFCKMSHKPRLSPLWASSFSLPFSVHPSLLKLRSLSGVWQGLLRTLFAWLPAVYGSNWAQFVVYCKSRCAASEMCPPFFAPNKEFFCLAFPPKSSWRFRSQDLSFFNTNAKTFASLSTQQRCTYIHCVADRMLKDLSQGRIT